MINAEELKVAIKQNKDIQISEEEI